MKEASYSPSHPVLFVFDFANTAMEVPAYDAESVVSSNDSCISIRTAADVDGDVTVALESAPVAEQCSGLTEVFRGTIDTPSRKIAVVTSENRNLLEEEIGGNEATVRVLVDDAEHASRVLVVIG